ncbi:hypothetical protein ES703_33769 [subsurface metagenome]
MKKSLRLSLRVAVSGILLAYLLSRVDIKFILSSLNSANLFWLAVTFSLHIVAKFISGYRWQLLLATQDIHIPLKTLISSLLVGQFFNNFSPSTIGGDIMRTYDTSKYSKNAAVSLTVILVERLTGFLALLLIAALAMVFGFRSLGDTSLLWALIGFFSLILLVFLGLFNSTLSRQIRKIFNFRGLSRVRGKIDKVYQALDLYKSKRKGLLVTFLFGLALQVSVVVHYYLIGLALGLHVSVLYFFIIIPLVHLILLLPVSINGIGVRENAYVLFLGKIGVEGSIGIALSWLAFGMILIIGVIGGIIYALRK